MKVILFISLFFLVSCNDYQKLMKPAIEAKLNDKNTKPVFDGEVEPELPDFDKIVQDDVGVDQNKNGIRDDVDIWINRTGKNYNERMAMRQFAHAIEKMIINCNLNINNDLQVKTDNWLASTQCLRFITKSDEVDQYAEGYPVYNLEKVIYGNFIKRCWKFLNKNSPSFSLKNGYKPYLNCNFEVKK